MTVLVHKTLHPSQSRACRTSVQQTARTTLAGPRGEIPRRSNLPTCPTLPTFSAPPKLLVKYDFDETSGVVVPDSSGNERHGRLEGTGTWVTGRLGNALHFDGATGYITMPVGIIGQRAQLTIARWVWLAA